MELCIIFKEFSPPGLPGSVQLFAALLEDPTDLSLDLCEDGVVVMDKPSFRKLAGIAVGAPIGTGHLLWDLYACKLSQVSE